MYTGRGFLPSQRRPFKFNATTHEFTVLQLSDIHYGEDDDWDEQTTNIIYKLLNETNPDLVVITGDTVSGYAWNTYSPRFFLNSWRKYTEPFAFTFTPYAVALGNHDAEADLTAEEIFALEQKHPFSVSVHQSPPEVSGVSNFLIQVESSLNKSGAFHPALNLWVLDSDHEGCGSHENSWGCIKASQIDWYSNLSDQLQTAHGKGDDIMHVAFFHIPVPEYMSLWNDDPVYGDKFEDVACPLENTGFFERVKQRQDIEAMFVGHDHNNYYGGFRDGIELVFGRKTGVGGYGPIEGVTRGARVIKFTEEIEKGKIVVRRRHWILDEDGNVIENGNMTRRSEGKQDTCSPAKTWWEIFMRKFWGGRVKWVAALIVACWGISLIIARYTCLRNKEIRKSEEMRIVSLNGDGGSPDAGEPDQGEDIDKKRTKGPLEERLLADAQRERLFS
eukprot:TRINITY_DN11325_c0_g2_i2.p1 TRINITY_DN11325_c0_g2~~TRINITY_DN11325_c0_g2_i2.p1  ORF type:complete len:446 (-),score=79.39 TRINITY_DN11325_c0_g2_i2:202-1539(-)